MASSALSRLVAGAADVIPKDGLQEKLALDRPLRVKLGIDPSRPDLHLGHAVVLRKLRHFQDAGHVAVLIVGDFTGRVGDPSGQSETRPFLTEEEIEENATTYLEQAGKVLDMSSAEVRRNSEWLAGMGMADVLRLTSAYTVARMLERDDFRKRYEEGKPISVVEFLYPLMQAMDSVAVRADVELGGTDQTFNLFMGRALQTTFGQPPQVVLTVPLLTGIDGERKMSKSYDNQIGITEPPGEMYGKTLRIPDTQLESWYGLLLGGEIPAGVGPRDAKRALARALVARFWGEEAAAEAEAGFDRVFIAHALPEAIDEIELSADGGTLHLPQVIVEVFGGSRSEARRKLAQGGVKLDGEPVPAEPLDVPAQSLDGRVLQLGKRQFRRLRIS